jgi:putative hemolysin
MVQREDGSWLVEGSVNVDDVAAVLSLSGLGGGEGTHPEYHTLAGFILELAGEIPKPGAVCEYGGSRFQVVDMEGNRIGKVAIRRVKR